MSQANGFTNEMLSSLVEEIEDMERVGSLSNQELIAEGLILGFPDVILDEMCSRLDPCWAYRDQRGH
jgi:hypothetical protein